MYYIMKKLYFCLFMDIVACIILFLLLFYESSSYAVGMAALSSVGRWVIYLIAFIFSIVCLIALLIVIVVKHKKFTKNMKVTKDEL